MLEPCTSVPAVMNDKLHNPLLGSSMVTALPWAPGFHLLTLLHRRAQKLHRLDLGAAVAPAVAGARKVKVVSQSGQDIVPDVQQVIQAEGPAEPRPSQGTVRVKAGGR